MKRKVSAATRLLHELFNQYPSTFLAFCELINNSIQARSRSIDITIDYATEEEIFPTAIKSITIKDDGTGVHLNIIQNTLLDFGDSTKKGGKGIGRFAAIQIGSDVLVESVGYDNEDKTFSKVIIPFNEQYFKSVNKIEQLEIDTEETLLKGLNHKTYYKVSMKNIYDASVTGKHKKRRISERLLKNNINNAIFERYSILIFSKSVKFRVNGIVLKAEDFIEGVPDKIASTYRDTKGKEHIVLFTYMKLKAFNNEIKVFLTTKNEDIDTIVGGFEYNADWISPNSSGWFVYIHSDELQTDLYRRSDLENMDDDANEFKAFIKDKLNQFFKGRNREYDDFLRKLKKDVSYPYKEEKASSQTKITLFDKLAYLVEDRYNLIKSKSKLRELIYPLIDRTITTGELDKVLKKILHLENKQVKQLNSMLDRAKLEDFIDFSEKVSRKVEDLEFLEKLAYSEISKYVLERKELHKVLEKMLWVFGEQYLDNTRLLSDKSLRNNLEQLREQTLKYKPDKKADNINQEIDKKIKSITDLFLYSEKPLDDVKREVLIVELKAPKVKLSPVEIQQAMNYATEIASSSFYSDDIQFHIILIGSDINKGARFQLDGIIKPRNNPYFYFENPDKNISISILKWSQLIEMNKRKLNYLSTHLKINDVKVDEKIKNDFSDIGFERVKSVLRKVPIPD